MAVRARKKCARRLALVKTADRLVARLFNAAAAAASHSLSLSLSLSSRAAHEANALVAEQPAHSRRFRSQKPPGRSTRTCALRFPSAKRGNAPRAVTRRRRANGARACAPVLLLRFFSPPLLAAIPGGCKGASTLCVCVRRATTVAWRFCQRRTQARPRGKEGRDVRRKQEKCRSMWTQLISC